MSDEGRLVSRRALLIGGAAALAAACSRSSPQTQATASASRAPDTSLTPTPSCEDGDEPTIAQTEGPYFTPDSPEKSDFTNDVDGGTKLILTGSVLSTSCEPVGQALLDFWHADDTGNYDNEGYNLRGHMFTGDEGNYRLHTIVPALYTGRTRHIHVKVQAPNGPVLTTQLYFPDEPANESDSIYSPELVMDLRDTSDGKAGTFTFVVGT
ncbi:MAG: dioxygenase [Actinomycetota bacterium]